jgi:hypothetical protein
VGDVKGFGLLRKKVEIRGIPHLAKNERDAPNFLYAAMDKAACAPFLKERRMKCAGPINSTGNRGCGAPGMGGRVRVRRVSRFSEPDLEAIEFKAFEGLRPVFSGPGTLERTWGTRP